jgi:hypothetical protein
MEVVVVVIFLVLLGFHPTQRHEKECGNEDRTARR